MLTVSQKYFIALLEQRGIEGEHQIPYIKQQFNATQDEAIKLQCEYWDEIYKELNPPKKPEPEPVDPNVPRLNNRGEQVFQVKVGGIVYSLGWDYEAKRFEWRMLFLRLSTLAVGCGALLYVAHLFAGGV